MARSPLVTEQSFVCCVDRLLKNTNADVLTVKSAGLVPCSIGISSRAAVTSRRHIGYTGAKRNGRWGWLLRSNRDRGGSEAIRGGFPCGCIRNYLRRLRGCGAIRRWAPAEPLRPGSPTSMSGYVASIEADESRIYVALTFGRSHLCHQEPAHPVVRPPREAPTGIGLYPFGAVTNRLN
jgi:hypothetical protein